jgi:hypothetical protein
MYHLGNFLDSKQRQQTLKLGGTFFKNIWFY